ncbi:MAG: hypothetical protein PHS42_07840 [Sulfurimonas sp.]|nr:hypothetical protein [Sulfurimonas sp.]MDD3835372.1 hypothetical protein [Sulfurimonas sp.]
MKNILKSIIFKLSYNPTIKKIANKIFIYFPSLKVYLLNARANTYIKSKKITQIYKSNFLESIKKEIEAKRLEENR